MIVFYGKWKVWTSFKDLCDYLGKECILMDDNDRNDTVLQQATIIVPTPWISQTHAVYTMFSDKITAELDMCYSIMQEQGLNPKTIGITGTDGKSTVTWLIAETLTQLLPSHQIHITWNFDEAISKTILDILKAWTKGNHHIFVVECSSFMLYATKKYHFDIWIRTNFAPDHLNWHPTLQEYFAAKQQLFVNSDICYTTQEIYEQLDKAVQAKTKIYNMSYDLNSTQFVGKHNEKNCALTFQVIKENYALKDEDIIDAIWTIKPLKHRMQPIKTTGGITRYDDGKSTSAQSLGAALQSFDQPIIVICGGSDKWDSFDNLSQDFKHNTAHGIFLWQTSQQFAHIFDIQNIPYTLVTTMPQCVEQARHAAQQHNAKVILFSPGCASFDMFKNYEDRAEQFIDAVNRINV